MNSLCTVLVDNANEADYIFSMIGRVTIGVLIVAVIAWMGITAVKWIEEME